MKPTIARDRGFTLVEILVAIVLVGALSSIVVLGVDRLAAQGSAAGCSASADAARTAVTTHFAMTGSRPTSFADLFASGALEPAAGVSTAAAGLALVGSGWSLLWHASPSGPPWLDCTDAALGAQGLSATVFNTVSFTNPVQTFVHSTATTANWSYGTPYPGMGDTFSVRYTGTITIPTSGTWTFTGTADNQIVLWINNQQVLAAAGTNRVALAAGTYSMRIDFVETGAAAAWSLSWTPPGGTASQIPTSALTSGTAPDVATPTPAPTLTTTALTATTAAFSVTPAPAQPKILGTATVALTCTAPGQTTRTSTAKTWLIAADNLATGATYTCTATLDGSPASPPVAVTPAAPAAAIGLSATVYNTSTFTNPITTYVHATSASANWSYGTPYPGMVDVFSIRYTGSITIPSTGTWTFSTRADNLLTLWIDGVQLLSTSNGSASRTLVAGTYPIRIDYRETGAAADWYVRWTAPGGIATVIPANALSTI